jgi:hypothetical protein
MRDAANEGLPPIDHQLVGVVQQGPRRRDYDLAGLQIEGLGDAVRVGGSRIVGVRQLEIALRQLVGTLRARDQAVGIDDGRIVIRELGRPESATLPLKVPRWCAVLLSQDMIDRLSCYR